MSELQESAAGLRQPAPEPEAPAEIPTTEEDEPEFSPDPSIGQAVKSGISAERAWTGALEQLKLEVPHAVFSEYVGPARLAAYEPATGVFTIAASNAYSRDWLQSRLGATLTRMLTGICYQSVEIRFVCLGYENIPD